MPLALQHWYAVHTRSRFEKAVHLELERKGVESYLPTFSELRQWKDRKKLVELPLFSGYLFARLLDEDRARFQVLTTPGVVKILGTNGGPEPVPNREIDALQRALRTGKTFCPHPFVRQGAWVRVKRGVLAGIEGRLLRFKSKTRLLLSMELLSQAVATEVDVMDVEPAREPHERNALKEVARCTRI